MATVVIFHSALGLRPSVLDFAEELRSEGHDVYTPDFYGGRHFDSLDDGVEYGDGVGPLAFVEQMKPVIAEIPKDAVYLGFSLGAVLAQYFAQYRPGARGAILLHAVVDPSDLGRPWPTGMPLQAHTAEGDPWVELPEARTVIADINEVTPGSATLFLYPGDHHLFMDEASDDYDPESAQLAASRIREFLAAIG